MNVKNRNDLTALTIATRKRNSKICVKLIKYGAIIHHHPATISWSLSILVRSEETKVVGEGENMFHLRRNEKNTSLLDYIVNRKLKRQKDLLIDVLIKNDFGRLNYQFDLPNSDFQIGKYYTMEALTQNEQREKNWMIMLFE